MKRLTRWRAVDGKDGYKSSASKEDLVQALGKYEDSGCTPQEVMDVCFYYVWENAKSSTPARKGYYWVTTQHEGIRNVIRAYFDGEWQVSCPDRVIARKPMEKQPEPYAG